MTKKFFLESDSDQLAKIYQWARARYAAPWAVFFAVLLRVSASLGPHVQLPGVIGGRASLNLLCAFVSLSGGGKGISDKVGRLAWPRPITELPIGSGEGIAATFKPPAKPDGDAEPIDSVIFNCSEIDVFTGIATRQGSTILGTLKAFAMGELLGATNASAATSRNVQAHTYRGCLSVGAQPGHTGIIFDDTTGGTPQRFLWAPTIDPDMPAQRTADPAPLDTDIPLWTPGMDGVVEIGYGPPEITEQIIAAHLARQRGDGDALDGHWMLTRCKVAALLAVMHQRSVVSESDWELAATVMAVSDATRQMLLDHAKQAARAKIRDRALSRATFDEIIDERHGTTVRNRIMRLLANGPMPRGELRRAMGKQHYREAFDAVLPYLEKICEVVAIPGEKAPHYAINPEFTGEPGFTPRKASSTGVNHEFTGEPSATVTDLDTRRSHDNGRPKLSCRKWLAQYVAQLLEGGQQYVAAADVYRAGEAAGYGKQNVATAQAQVHQIRVAARDRSSVTWCIDPAVTLDYQPVGEWIANYIDRLPTGVRQVDETDFRRAGEAAGYGWSNLRNAANRHPRLSVGGGALTIAGDQEAAL
ncbi:hypothetical protein AWC09_11030 [Mycolicibacter hiberniae]|nr:hypothetical protein AWC09_11030 [Mycolicibacter hiberniae]